MLKNKRSLRKAQKGFTLAEMMITMAVITIFLAVVLPLVTLQKQFAANDRDAYACVVQQGASNLTTPACAAVLTKCQYNQSNACAALNALTLNSNYATAALKVIDTACSNGGKKACSILVNRCIDNASQCSLDDNTNTTYEAAAPDDYSIHKYTDMDANSNNYGKIIMYELLKKKVSFDINNIVNRAITDCGGKSTSMACTILNRKIYDFNDGQESQFTIEDGEIDFRNSLAELTVGPGGEQPYNCNYALPAADMASASMVVDADYVYLASFGGQMTEFLSGVPEILKLNKLTGAVVFACEYIGNVAFIADDADFIYASSHRFGAFNGNDYGWNGSYHDLNLVKIRKSDCSAVYTKAYDGTTVPTNIQAEHTLNIKVKDNFVYTAGTLVYTSGTPTPRAFVAQYDKGDGTLNWIRYIDTPLDPEDWKHRVVLATQNNQLYVSFTEGGDSAAPDLGNIPDDGNIHTILINFNSDGSVAWKKRLIPDGFGHLQSEVKNILVVDDKLFMIGGSVTEVYYIRIDISGAPTVDWVKVFGVGRPVYTNGLETDGTNIYINGRYLTVDGDYNLFSLAFAPEGNLTNNNIVWSRTFGSINDDDIVSNNLVLSNGFLYGAYTTLLTPYEIGIYKMSTTQTSNISPPDTIFTQYLDAWGFDLTTWSWLMGTADIPISDIRANFPERSPNNEDPAAPDYYQDDTNEVSIKPSYFNYGTEPFIGGGSGGASGIRYMTTKSGLAGSQIRHISSRIISAAITQTTPADTDIRYFVSFDGRSTWRKWNGTDWVEVNTAAGLSDPAVVALGNTEVQVEQGLTRRTPGSNGINGNSLDFAIIMSAEGSESPSLDRIDVRYY
jgi:prepilin-type N-terminal cleavage/methylation domain-containing protein